MKIKILSIVCAAVLCVSSAACSTGDKEARTEDNGSARSAENTNGGSEVSSEADFDEILKNYVRPTEMFSLDMTKEDPSSEDVTFSYDDDGRLSGCYYKCRGMQIMVTYEYNDDDVRIYTFANEYVVDNVTFKAEKYDKNIGFSECGGYYFKGVTVSEINTAF